MVLVNDRDANAQLTAILETARQNGLPVDPILSKVKLGVVRRVPAQRIVAAARAVASRLEVARDALAPHPSDGDIAAGEDALGAGATPKSLREIRALSPVKPVATPLGLLAQLVADSVPTDRASKIVGDLMKRGATPAQLNALGNDVNHDVSNGAAATTALDIRMRGLTAVLGAPGGGSAAAASPTAISGSGPKKP